MDNISQERVRLSVAEARELAEKALGRIGYDAEEARIVADHVIDAALCGYEYSGLPKILNRHQSDCIRISDAARTRGHRLGHFCIHVHRPAVPRAPLRAVA